MRAVRLPFNHRDIFAPSQEQTLNNVWALLNLVMWLPITSERFVKVTEETAEALQEMDQLQMESKRLDKSVKECEAEVEERKPVLTALREEYASMQSAVRQVQAELVAAGREDMALTRSLAKEEENYVREM